MEKDDNDDVAYIDGDEDEDDEEEEDYVLDDCDDCKIFEEKKGFTIEGRRVVELSLLGKKLDEGCFKCSGILRLSSCIGETRYGLGSQLHIMCTKCEAVNYIPTGKVHGLNIWDINTKLGAALLFCGLGETAINNLFAAINLPHISATTLKRRERETGIVFESVADMTCDDAIAEEKRRCENEEQYTASFDAGWQTRGSGRNYASLSGHASMIGRTTGKVISYAVRLKKCRSCEKDDNNNDHDCRKNWDRSSKAMESDMALEMLHELKAKDFHVKSIIMDNDTTTIAKAKAAFDPSLQKFADFNHTKKNFTSKLYDLKKAKRYQLLGPKTIKHLGKCFAYAVKSNNDAISLKKNLNSIPGHVFGDHSICSEDWCGYIKDPVSENYEPRNLPYSKYLTGEDLLTDLKSLFSVFSNNAEKLCSTGSTQSNENFNKVVSAKNPKTHFYGGSESTSFRVAAAVAQKNIGHESLSKVFERLLLSPGKCTTTHAEKMNRKRENERARRNTVEFKRRRLELKSAKATQVFTSEIKEGPTYESGIDLSSNENCSLEVIPDIVSHPCMTSIGNCSPKPNCSFLFFDLETTGFGPTAEIVQLSCVCGDEKFDRYVFPNSSFDAKASAVTGLHITRRLL